MAKPTNRNLLKLQTGAAGKFDALVDRLATGTLDIDNFADEVNDVLQDAHAEAWALGRQRAGIAGPRNDEDDFMGRGLADSQMSDYFDGFLDAIEGNDPRYVDADGKLRPDGIKYRLRMYASSLKGTASEAFVEESPETHTFDWVLGAKESCPGCLDMEADNPYRQDEMWTYPGAGSHECKHNCRCHIKRDDGVTSLHTQF